MLVCVVSKEGVACPIAIFMLKVKHDRLNPRTYVELHHSTIVSFVGVMPKKNTTAGRKAAGISATETLAAASSLPQATTWAHLTRKENLLALAIFIDLLAVAMVVPLLPQRMAELGVDTATIGYIKYVPYRTTAAW